MTPLRLQISDDFWKDEPKTFVVHASRKRVWAVLLDLYAEFARVCDKYGLRYCADSGTLIGALRHQGMIPWDDDIDLLMPRSDYERLCEVAATEFSFPYFWQTEATDPLSARGHAQLRNSETTGILKEEMFFERPLFSFNQGLFIDIFPLDNVPDDLDERAIFCSRLQHLREKIYATRLAYGYSRLSPLKLLRHPSWMWLWMKGWIFRFIDLFAGKTCVTRLAARCETLAQKYNDRPTRDCAPVAFRPRRKPGEFYSVEGFNTLARVPFEMLEMPIPSHAEAMLKGQYGDWRRYVVEGTAHGGLLLDVDHSYTDYLDR